MAAKKRTAGEMSQIAPRSISSSPVAVAILYKTTHPVFFSRGNYLPIPAGLVGPIARITKSLLVNKLFRGVVGATAVATRRYSLLLYLNRSLATHLSPHARLPRDKLYVGEIPKFSD